MSYIDCPCYSYNDRTTGAKRVACHPECERFAAWKAKQHQAERRMKNDSNINYEYCNRVYYAYCFSVYDE